MSADKVSSEVQEEGLAVEGIIRHGLEEPILSFRLFGAEDEDVEVEETDDEYDYDDDDFYERCDEEYSCRSSTGDACPIDIVDEFGYPDCIY